MSQSPIFLIYVSCLLLSQLTGTLSFASPEGQELIAGHVRDGLHFESQMRFTEAISEYKKATLVNGQDRYAWVRLARAYQANEQYWQALLDDESTQQKLLAPPWMKERRRAVAPAYLYWNAKSDRAKFGYYLPLDKSAVGSIGYVFDRYDIPLFPGLWMSSAANFVYGLNPVYAKYALYRTSDQSSDSSVDQVCGRAEAWSEVDAYPEKACNWLKLARAHASIGNSLAEAAYHVALLSDPNEVQTEEARLGIDRVCFPACSRSIIAPVKPLLDGPGREVNKPSRLKLNDSF
jgi:hypothetical protein